jgi:hypothetical protein
MASKTSRRILSRLVEFGPCRAGNLLCRCLALVSAIVIAESAALKKTTFDRKGLLAAYVYVVGADRGTSGTDIP